MNGLWPGEATPPARADTRWTARLKARSGGVASPFYDPSIRDLLG